MKRFHIYKTKIIYYISVNNNFAYIPFLKFINIYLIIFEESIVENKTNAKVDKQK